MYEKFKELDGTHHGTLDISRVDNKSDSHLNLEWEDDGQIAFKGIGIIHNLRISTIYWSVEIDGVINPK